MKCDIFRARILEEYWGSLAPGERRSLDEHLRSCPECFEEKKRMIGLLDEMITQKEYDPGDAYWDSFNKRVFSRIDEHSGKESAMLAIPLRVRLVTAIVLAVSALVLLPFTYRYLFRQTESPFYERELHAAIMMSSSEETYDIVEGIIPFYREDSFSFPDLEYASFPQEPDTAPQEESMDELIPYSLIEELNDSEKEDLLSQIELEMG